MRLFEGVDRASDPSPTEDLSGRRDREVVGTELDPLGAEGAREVGTPVHDHRRFRGTGERDEAPPEFGEGGTAGAPVPQMEGDDGADRRDGCRLLSEIGVGEDAGIGDRVEPGEGPHVKRGRGAP